MVRKDDTEGRPQRQKSAGLGPATLDLNAAEVASESSQPTTEGSSAASEPVIASLDSSSVATDTAHAAPTAGLESAKPVRDAGRSPRDVPPELNGSDPLPPTSSRSGVSVILAAVVGGIVAGALILAAAAFGLISLGKGGAEDGLAPRLAAAEQDLASNKAAIDQALAKVNLVEASAKSAQDAATNALNLAGEAEKAAAANAGNEAAATAPTSVPDLSGIGDRMAKAETDVTALNDAMRQVNTATSSLAQQVAALKSAAGSTPDKAAAYAVALAQLGDAIRSGKPFKAELDTATALSGNADALAPLANLAQNGTPSVESLASQFEAIKPQILAALTPKPAASAGTGVMDRWMASLGKVVTVTREGDVSASDPGWPAQQVSDTLRRGDLPSAIAAFKTMPEAGRQAGAAWLAQASGAATAFDLIKAQTGAALQKFTGQ
jgi:hypothetical protein